MLASSLPVLVLEAEGMAGTTGDAAPLPEETGKAAEEVATEEMAAEEEAPEEEDAAGEVAATAVTADVSSLGSLHPSPSSLDEASGIAADEIGVTALEAIEELELARIMDEERADVTRVVGVAVAALTVLLDGILARVLEELGADATTLALLEEATSAATGEEDAIALTPLAAALVETGVDTVELTAADEDSVIELPDSLSRLMQAKLIFFVVAVGPL